MLKRYLKKQIRISSCNYRKKDAKEKNVNKFDQYDLGVYPDYLFYSNKRQNYTKREDIQKIFTKLKVESEPFFPKGDKKSKLADIDISKVKEFYPKNYKVVSKETIHSENN